MRIPFWGSVLTIIGVSILCMLGSWQVNRLDWKQDLLARIAVEKSVDALSVDLSNTVLADDVILKRGFLKGRYLHRKSIFIRPRTFEGVPGYHVFTPFEVVGAQIPILVNRGWVPIEQERSKEYTMTLPESEVIITGVLRKVPKVNMFVSENAPDRDAWYHIDLRQIARSKNIQHFHDNLFYAEEERVEKKMGAYPIPAMSHASLNNNHLQYALFWFFLAGVMAVIYILRFIVPQFHCDDLE